MATVNGNSNRRIWSSDDFEDPLLRVLKDKECSDVIVKVLIHYGAKVNQYPLYYALFFSKDVPIISALLDAGANPHKQPYNRSALCYAFEYSSIGVVRLLLDKGCSQDACDSHGDSVLHCAVNSPTPLKKDVLELLLERGADVTQVGLSGQTIMCNALGVGVEAPLLKMLLDAGALFDDCTRHPNPLICATSSVTNHPLSVDVIKMLLELGACPYEVDYRGCTALQLALWFGDCNTEVIQLLMDIPGVDVNTYHLLNYATRNQKCKVSVVELLLQRGARVDSEDAVGNMPIHYAVRRCSLDVLKLLLENGSSASASNQSGETPLVLAMKWRNEPPILTALFLAGARVGELPFDLLEKTLEYGEEPFLDMEDCFKLLVKFCLVENPSLYIQRWMALFVFPVYHYPWDNFPNFVCNCAKEIQKICLDHGNELCSFMLGNDSENNSYLNRILKAKPDIGDYRMFFDIIAARIKPSWMTSKLQSLRVYATKLDSSSSCEEEVFLNYESVCAIAKLLSPEDLLRFIMAYQNH